MFKASTFTADGNYLHIGDENKLLPLSPVSKPIDAPFPINSDSNWTALVGDTAKGLSPTGVVSMRSLSRNRLEQSVQLNDLNEGKIIWADFSPDLESVWAVVQRDSANSPNANLFWGRWNTENGTLIKRSARYGTRKLNSSDLRCPIINSKGWLEAFQIWDRNSDTVYFILDSQEDDNRIPADVALENYGENNMRKRPIPDRSGLRYKGDMLATVKGTSLIFSPIRYGAFTGAMLHEGTPNTVRMITDREFVTGCEDGRLSVWGLTQPIAVPPRQTRAPRNFEPEEEEALVFSSDGQWVFHHKGANLLTVLEEVASKHKFPLHGFPGFGPAWDMQVSNASGVAAITGNGHLSGEDFLEGAYLFYGFRSGTPETHLLRHTKCRSLSFDSTGELLSTVGGNRIQLWDVKNRSPRVGFVHDGVTYSEFSSDGKSLVSWSKDGSGKLWDVRSGKSFQSFLPTPMWGFYQRSFEEGEKWARPAISSDGRFVGSAFGHALLVWDVATGKPLCDPVDCSGTIRRVVFSSDGHSIFADLNNGACFEWTFDPFGNAPALGDFNWLDDVVKSLALCQSEDSPAPKHETSAPISILRLKYSQEMTLIRNRHSFGRNSQEALVSYWNKALDSSLVKDSAKEADIGSLSEMKTQLEADLQKLPEIQSLRESSSRAKQELKHVTEQLEKLKASKGIFSD